MGQLTALLVYFMAVYGICNASGPSTIDHQLMEQNNYRLESEKKLKDMEQTIEKLRNDIRSVDAALSKLVSLLVHTEVKQESTGGHSVNKRDVLSSNAISDLALKDLTGLRGPPGKDGKDGARGPPGIPGTASGGSVYTRWGRTSCGADSTLMYNGFAGSTVKSRSGGGVNYQCMPYDPQYNNLQQSSGRWLGSYMGGVEYLTYSFGVFPNSAHTQNVPCARCYTNNRSALMMIPAKRDCSEGWTKEYEGHLMTAYDKAPHASTYECVDSSPQYVPGEEKHRNCGEFHFIRPDCTNGAQCPPYKQDKEMTCVVCSK